MVLPRTLRDHALRFWSGPETPADTAVSPDAITIVTAFFDIGRDNWGSDKTRTSRSYERGTAQYMAYFANLSRIPNDLVVFIQPDLAEQVLALRKSAGLAARTTIYTIDALFDLDEIRPLSQAIAARMTETFRRFVWRPDAPESNHPTYVLINALKSTFVLTALDLGAIRTPQAAWIDFGYCRTDGIFDPATEWKYDARGKINLFHGTALDDRPIFDIIRDGSVYFQGGHILGPRDAWRPFNTRLSAAMTALLGCDLVDDDQTLLLMAWRAAPDDHIAHPVDLTGPLGWFFIFRRFHTGAPTLSAAPPPIKPPKHPPWIREIRAAWKRRSSGI